MNKFLFYKTIFDDGAIELIDGSFCFIIQILGFEFDFLDLEEQNNQIRILANFFKRQENKITFFKTDLIFNFHDQEEFLKALKYKEKEKYLKQLKLIQIEKQTENCYFFFIYSHSKEELKNNLNNSLNILNKGNLTAYQSTIKTINILLNKFFSIKNSKEELETPYYLNFKKSNFHTEKYWKKVLTINQFPLYVNNSWLKEIVNLKDTDFIFQIENISLLDAKEQLNKSLSVLKVNYDNEKLPSEQEEIEANLNSMQNLITEITTGNEFLKNVSFQFIISSYLKEELLQEKENKLKEIIQQHNLNFEGNYLNQQNAFYTCLPKINEEKNKSKQLISSLSLASFFPFLVPNQIDEKGLILGKIKNGYLFFDLFLKSKERKNSNMFIIGTSGSGKSFFSKKLIEQRIITNDKVFIIDPEREYKNLKEKYNGNRFDCSKKFKTLNFKKQLTILDFFNLLDMENRKNFDEKIFIILQKIENEIQRNYLENIKNKEENKFVILIDEAHLLISNNRKETLLFFYQLTKRIRKYNGSIILITQNLSDFFASEETKEFSKAIIKNCNYSAFFQLHSGDVNDLEKLNKNNPLSEKEKLLLPQLGRGNCLFNLDSEKRFLVEVLNN